MVPSFEKRVRAFAIDTSGVALVGILAIGVSPQSETLSYVIFLAAAFFLGSLLASAAAIAASVESSAPPASASASAPIAA